MKDENPTTARNHGTSKTDNPFQTRVLPHVVDDSEGTVQMRKNQLLLGIMALMLIMVAGAVSGANSWDTGKWTDYSMDNADTAGGTLTDSNLAYDATYHNLVTGASGIVNEAYDFEADNGDEYVDTPFDIKNLTNDWTFSCWVKPESFVNSMSIAKSNGGWFELDTDTGSGNQWNFRIYDGSGYNSLLTAANDNGWSMVTATYDGTNMSLYVNDTLGATQTASNFDGTSYVIDIGRKGGANQDLWDGLIDECYINLDTALTSAQVTDKYNHGAAGFRQNESAPSNLITTLTYPTNETTYYQGSATTWNGSILVALSGVSWSATCDINDSRFSLLSVPNTPSDDSVYDESGQGNHGTLGSAVVGDAAEPTLTTGQYNEAYEFDGDFSQNHITTDYQSSITSNGKYSFLAWVYVGDNDGGRGAVIFQNSGGSTDRNAMSAEDGIIRFGYYDGGWTYSSSDSSYRDEWVYVAGINNNGSLSLYINGSLQSGGDNVYAHLDNSYLYLGRNSLVGDINDTFNGSIDEVRIWNRTLNQSEIQAEMNSGDPVKSSGLILSLDMDNNTGFGNETIHWINNTAYNTATNISLYINCTDAETTTEQNFWFALKSNMNISLDYPVDGTTYYGNYNGSVFINYTDNWGAMSCSINDTRWSYFNDTGSQYIFRNNTDIIDNNISFLVNCTDASGAVSNTSFSIFLDTILEMFFYDEETQELLNGTNITVDLKLGTSIRNYSTINGTLNITSLDFGDWRASYTADGYENNEYYFTIFDGKKTTLNLYLINTTITDQIQFFILSGADQSPVDGAKVSIYRVYDGGSEIVKERQTDFVGSVFFEMDTNEEYILQITKTGFVTKTTNTFQPSTTNSPYTIFIDLSTITEYFNIFDFLDYFVSPSSGIVDNDKNLTINFSVQSSSNSIDYFNFSTTTLGRYYSQQSSLSGGETLSDTIIINSSHPGQTIDVDFVIVYDGVSGTETFTFQRHYFVSNLNKTTNITLSDSIQELNDKIDATEDQPDLVKIVFICILISAFIYILYRSGLDGKFAAALGMLLLIPAAYFGFVAWVYAILGNVMYFFYLFMAERDIL